MLGELIHRKLIHVFSEVRLWDENQRDFSRAVKTAQLSYNSNSSFQNLEAINTSDVLFECSGISPLGRHCTKKTFGINFGYQLYVIVKILKCNMQTGTKKAMFYLFLSKAFILCRLMLQCFKKTR